MGRLEESRGGWGGGGREDGGMGSSPVSTGVRIPGRMPGACVLHASVPAFPQ